MNIKLILAGTSFLFSNCTVPLRVMCLRNESDEMKNFVYTVTEKKDGFKGLLGKTRKITKIVCLAAKEQILAPSKKESTILIRLAESKKGQLFKGPESLVFDGEKFENRVHKK